MLENTGASHSHMIKQPESALDPRNYDLPKDAVVHTAYRTSEGEVLVTYTHTFLFMPEVVAGSEYLDEPGFKAGESQGYLF